MRAAAFSLIAALLATLPAAAQTRRPANPRYVESPASGPYREGMRLLADEHWAEAAERFEEAIDLDEQYALAFYGLGRARMGQKQYTAAVGALNHCSALYQQQAATTTGLRMNQAQAKRDQIFELREMQRSLQSGPMSTARQAEVERINHMIQDLEASLNEDMSGMIVRAPAFVSLSLGSAHFRRGAMAEAEREYRNAIKANPRMGEAHNNLAVVLLLTGRPLDAEKSVKDAEKNGFRVPSAIKEDIKRAKTAAQSS
jgi:tetratricopeptide (TPR) repeat protein